MIKQFFDEQSSSFAYLVTSEEQKAFLVDPVLDNNKIYQDCYLFTGDTLLINGCGRTDFQNGDSGQLYDSISQKLFSLGENTIVLPGHDYNGLTRTTIGDQKRTNPRLANKSKDEFIHIMNNLNLPTPKLMDLAVPLNLNLGKSNV